MPIHHLDNTLTANIDSAKLNLIAQQLGRPPRGLRGVACETDKGVPVVLKMAPVVDEQPFPTLYWLCSKDLHKTISQIEAQGIIKQWEQKLHDEPHWQALYHQHHLDYIKERWAVCTSVEKQFLYQHNYQTVFNQKGIGGLSNWQQIRCLHMHYAHHLCGNNLIGEWMDAAYPHLQELTISI